MKRTCISTTVLITLLMLILPLVHAYDNSVHNFSITPPSGWTAKENVQGVVVQFIGPSDPATGAVNINVYVAETVSTLADVVSETKQDWSTALSDYSLVSEGSLSVNGHEGYELEFSFRNDGNVVKQHSVLFVENGKLYQVSYVAGSTTYDVYFDVYVESLKTFQIKPSGFSFGFEVTGIPFLLLVAVIIVIAVAVVIVFSRRKRKSMQAQSFPPPPPS